MIRHADVHNVYHELDTIVHDYYDRSGCAGEVQPKLDMDWVFYHQLDRLGRLVLLANYDHDGINGFVMYVLSKHPHHKTTFCAGCDILAVHYDHRGKGIGRRLVQRALPGLKDMGVTTVTHSYRTLYDAEPLFPKLGFTLIEQTYMKRLGE